LEVCEEGFPAPSLRACSSRHDLWLGLVWFIFRTGWCVIKSLCGHGLSQSEFAESEFWDLESIGISSESPQEADSDTAVLKQFEDTIQFT
jgi:hypothetical protein